MAQTQPNVAVPRAGTASARDAPEPKEFTFPAVTYACVELSIPDNDKAAEVAIEDARVHWYEAARRAGLKQASHVFIHAKVPTANAANNATTLPAEACGIVSDDSTAQGMKMHKLPPRQGLVGFCDSTLDVQACLASAAKEGRFTEAKPWPWLPMYASWPIGRPRPASEMDIIEHLRTVVFAIPSAPPGSGVPRERSTNGPKPLVECKDCAAADEPKEVDFVGDGIGWFLPLR